ncbi:MAG: hypothetical protein ACFN0J_05075, partial [Segatella salivae]
SKQQYKDDALKFRIIKVWRGCSPKEILWPNDVFDVHRNENTIRKIKKVTDSYDMELKQKADSLMQKKLKSSYMKQAQPKFSFGWACALHISL